MAWATPRTWLTSELVTAAMMNGEVRDNMIDLDRRTNAGLAEVLTNQGTTSTTFTDLATAGPAVTASVGGGGFCIVAISAHITPPASTIGYASYAVSGATTVSAVDWKAVLTIDEARIGVVNIQNGLGVGNNTFTMKYRTQAGTTNFSDRNVGAFPLGR